MVISTDERKDALRAALQVAFDFYYGQVPPEKQDKFLNLVNRTIRQFTFDAGSEFGVGACCPGWQECKDGRCVPPGEC